MFRTKAIASLLKKPLNNTSTLSLAPTCASFFSRGINLLSLTGHPYTNLSPNSMSSQSQKLLTLGLECKIKQEQILDNLSAKRKNYAAHTYSIAIHENDLAKQQELILQTQEKIDKFEHSISILDPSFEGRKIHELQLLLTGQNTLLAEYVKKTEELQGLIKYFKTIREDSNAQFKKLNDIYVLDYLTLKEEMAEYKDVVPPQTFSDLAEKPSKNGPRR